ncbi:TetR/AcrR family transcriptional regulator [Microbacterium trichothecenolyticum]|uniref:TetR/AcrR family transcriptional regulator n=1 Tax=Microbacterium trichothecenolyticum TaxID=69370 RepID=UPI001C6F4205|nr:helix-turn-helix domain-containing protein [Microbacterium trichothecenolyticum]MBW9119053.1 TetR/AcrR family transcriptional regulator [Microbacterium trichothecenolyticum]
MPTGQPLPDARNVLLQAGRRVLVAQGPGALNSRAVTASSGVAKGVLHRHFTDFDDYLGALVAEEARRIESIEPLVADSASAAVTDVLEQIFTPTMLGLASIVLSREGLRRRLRRDESPEVPLFAEATSVVADVLAAEREVGWIAEDADIPALALILVGSAHLLYVSAGEAQPAHDAIDRIVQWTLP